MTSPFEAQLSNVEPESVYSLIERRLVQFEEAQKHVTRWRRIMNVVESQIQADSDPMKFDYHEAIRDYLEIRLRKNERDVWLIGKRHLLRHFNDAMEKD